MTQFSQEQRDSLYPEGFREMWVHPSGVSMFVWEAHTAAAKPGDFQKLLSQKLKLIEIKEALKRG